MWKVHIKMGNSSTICQYYDSERARAEIRYCLAAAPHAHALKSRRLLLTVTGDRLRLPDYGSGQGGGPPGLGPGFGTGTRVCVLRTVLNSTIY